MRTLIVFAMLSSVVPAQTAPLDLAELMHRAAAAEKANSQKVKQYAYREYKLALAFDKSGKPIERSTETWDVIGLEGSTYRKLIQRNDKPLNPKDQKREDDRLAAETARRRNETPEQRRKRLFSFEYNLSFQTGRMPELYDLDYGGEEDIDGRPAYIVRGMPKAGLQPTTDNDRELLNYRAKVWIDKQDYVTSRAELEVIGDHSRMQKGSVLLGIDSRQDDGVWLAKEIRFRFDTRRFKMVNVHGETTFTYSDYHKFQVDSRLVP
jgi:hypothetical protein